MQVLRRSFYLILGTCLLVACGANPGLWGVQPTPTPPAEKPVETPSQTQIPSPTPLTVLPLPGTPTPGAAPTREAIGGGGLPIDVPPPTESLFPTATIPPINSGGPMDVYQSQGGDTLEIIARRFRVSPQQIISDQILPPVDKLIPPGTLLLLPKNSSDEKMSPGERSIPDSEVVYGPSALDFNLYNYISAENGYLNSYREYIISGGWTTGAQAVERISYENSLNPRLVLAIIEYESHWVRGQPSNLAADEYPLGHVDYHYRRLFRQLMWASGVLSTGYYEWRSGQLTTLTFSDGSTLRMNPQLNAGTAALQYYFAHTHDRATWEQIVAPTGFSALYAEMFGPPWDRAQAYEPTLPAGLLQPELSLPFEPGKTWAFTGGPHSAWEIEGALAALDFAPGSTQQGCAISENWALAPAPGVVVRTAPGVVVLDLDGDGQEQTGWNILFLHISSEGKVKNGAILQKDDKIGHPSCEGGISTGTHMHIARKYNGEWILADSPLPFNLDGWIAHAGNAPYKGTLTRGDVVITASTSATYQTKVIREKK